MMLPTAAEPDPIAILAGGGEFPRLVAEASARRGRRVLIFGIAEEASPQIAAFPHVWIWRGQLGSLFRRMRAEGIRDLVMIGGIRQRRMPRISEIDIGGLWAVLRNLALLRKGDDSVLRFVAGVIESGGIRVVGTGDVAPELVIGAGIHTRVAPDEADRRDISIGFRAARAHGARDRGQAAVARGGEVIARETAAGTDAMLIDIAASSPGNGLATRAGVLVKCLKPHQDRRLDMPAIGPDTVAQVNRAGLRGIAVGADETLVADLPAVVAELDRLGLFLIGLPAAQEGVDS